MTKIIKIEKDGCIPCLELGMKLGGLGLMPDEVVNMKDEGAMTLVDLYNIRSVPVLLKVGDDNELIAQINGVPDSDDKLVAFFK